MKVFSKFLIILFCFFQSPLYAQDDLCNNAEPILLRGGYRGQPIRLECLVVPEDYDKNNVLLYRVCYILWIGSDPKKLNCEGKQFYIENQLPEY